MKTFEELQHELEAYSTIGSTVTFGGRPIGEVVDEVFVMSPRYKHVIQRIRQYRKPVKMARSTRIGSLITRLEVTGTEKRSDSTSGPLPERAARFAKARSRKGLADLPVTGTQYARSSSNPGGTSNSCRA